MPFDRVRVCRDGVKSEFEEQLPLKEYAIRMPLYMAYRAPEILKLFVDSGRVKEMQVCAGDGMSGPGGGALRDRAVMYVMLTD